MPRKKAEIEAELAEAILDMPQKEKDKLLLRLLRKEPLLVEKLRHDFFSSKVDIEAERETIRQQIEALFSHPRYSTYHQSPGLAMMNMRDFAGIITRHVKTTQDKVGEVKLLLFLVEMPLRHLQPMLNQDINRAQKFAEYCCRKTQIALQKLAKLDRDYYLEFEGQVNEVLALLQAYPPTADLMANYELPTQWTYD